jgi:hypothetical protein
MGGLFSVFSCIHVGSVCLGLSTGCLAGSFGFTALNRGEGGHAERDRSQN